MNMKNQAISLLMFLLFLLKTTHCSYDCLKHCACEKKGEILVADCKGLMFTEVPEPAPEYQINILYLQYNRITRLRAGAFSLYGHLTEVYIQGNQMYAIEEGAFEGLERLQKLDLSKNMLSYVPDNEVTKLKSIQWLSMCMNGLRHIPAGISNLTKLVELDLSSNKFIKDIPPDSFPPSLAKLDMHGTAVKYFKKTSFQSLVNLKTLLLSDSCASGSVDFGSGVFDALVSLEYMDMSRCFCKRLPRNSFTGLHSLRTLLLNHCYLVEPPLLARPQDFFESPENNENSKNSSVTDVVSMYLTSTSIPKTEVQSSTHWIHDIWYNPQLALLDLSHNRNMPVGGTTVRFPPSLKELRLGYTKILSVDNNLFNETIDIQKLDLCHTKLQTIARQAFMKFRNVSEICLSGNPFTAAPILPPSLLTLNLSETKITNLTRAILRELSNVLVADLRNGDIEWIEDYAFGNMTSLLRLDLSENKLVTLEAKALDIGRLWKQYGGYAELSTEGPMRDKHSRVTEINLSSNLLRVIEHQAFSSHANLRSLYLQGNILEQISPGTFAGLRSLTMLQLNENRLIDIAPGSFSQLENLEVLDLNNNELEIIFTGTFKGMENLKRLNLAANSIILINPFAIESLEYLDISHNNITAFPKVEGKSLREISASWNPMENFHPGALDNIPNLEEFHLEHCSLGYLNNSIFRSTPNLRYLDLTDNSISRFLDKKMPALEVLIMGENELRLINHNLEDVAPQISRLDLSLNNITYLDPAIFSNSPTLQSIDLIGNNFQCNCELLPLVAWIEDNLRSGLVEVIDATSYMCEGPEDQYAVPVLVAVMELNCNKPNPPKSQKAQIYIGLGVVALIVVILLIFAVVSLCRKSRPDRRVNENGEAMITDNGGPNVMTSPKCCCAPCKSWWLGLNSYKHDRDQRGRIVSEERRDLMIASPPTSPTETDAPTL